MELSDPDIIKTLTEERPPLRRVTEGPKMPRRTRTRRCPCGRCTICMDNARWERIFQKKFADPAYYARSPLRHHSSLHNC